ncbi:MAG: hypothetical protein ACRESU_01985 [Gammaproteobacteria bacterium]
MKLSGLLLACFSLIPVAAWAGNFNYDYAELDYLHTKPQLGVSGKGPSAQLSYTISSMDVQLLTGYAQIDTPSTPADIDYHNYWVGIRGENSFGDSTDFYTDILYLNNRVTTQNSANTDDGYRLLLGMRHQVTDRIELDGSIGRDYLTQSDNQVALGLVFDVMKHLAVGLSYAHDNLHNNTATLRLRVYY